MPAYSPDQAGAGEQARTELLRGLFDDASLFPPASLSMAAAVAGHGRHATAWYASLTGPFVCPDTRLAELGSVLTAAGVIGIDVSVIVTAGAAAIASATDAVAADPRLRLRALEVPATGAAATMSTAGDDPEQAIRAVADALDAVPLPSTAAYIEVPPRVIAAARHAEDLLAIAADRGYRLKLRTGGTTSEAFPNATTLAACLTAVAGRRAHVKCTAGLHHAVRHTAADTGFEHHGFLNVLLAVGAADAGASLDEVAAVLAQREPTVVAEQVRAIDADQAERIRARFVSVGTCSTDEPVSDLMKFGLLSR
jgi:hypothetical protein